MDETKLMVWLTWVLLAMAVMAVMLNPNTCHPARGALRRRHAPPQHRQTGETGTRRLCPPTAAFAGPVARLEVPRPDLASLHAPHANGPGAVREWNRIEWAGRVHCRAGPAHLFTAPRCVQLTPNYFTSFEEQMKLRDRRGVTQTICSRPMRKV